MTFKKQVGDFFRLAEEIAIQIPALPRPSLGDSRARFPLIKSIERDTSPTDAVTLTLGTVFQSDERRVDGFEYERRIASRLDLCLGYQQAIWLEDHQDEFPKFVDLLGKVRIDFSGFVVVSARGGRRSPCLSSQGGRRWHLYWRWLDGDLGQGARFAVSGSLRPPRLGEAG